MLDLSDRVLHWLVRRLEGSWVTLLLFFTLVSVMSYSLEAANWVQQDSALLAVFNLGLLFGWLLARSRFPGWFAALYMPIISAAAAVQAIGGILPSLGQLLFSPFGETVNEMNLRAFELYLRATGWVELYQSGAVIEDPGPFVLLLSFILGLCGAWLVWAFLRLRSPLAGLLPVGLLFAVNVHLSRQPVMSYALFLFTALLLIVRSSYNQRMEDWKRRRVDFPEQLGLEWSGAAAGLALVIVLAARAAPLFGTPEGWQAISDWFKQYEEQTTETAEKILGGVNQPPEEYQEPEIMVNTPNLGEIGGSIPQGFETVMWVTTSDPPPAPPEMTIDMPYVITTVHYWRSGIYDTYTGRGWQEAAAQEAQEQASPPAAELPDDAPEGRYYLRQLFVIDALHSGELFSVNDPVQAGEGISLRVTAPDGSRLLQGQVEQYEVVSLATQVSANQLAAAPTDYPAEIRASYLQLPDSLPERVRALAGRVVNGAADPYHKAINIQNYLRGNFPYDLSSPAAPNQRDLVDYFLFDLKEGFCSHYATAMAVMLRAQGVPARVVTGYAMGEWSPERGAFRVPVSAAHAWVEVYFPGYGWIEFEPTAYRAPIEYPEEEDGSAGPSAAVQVGASSSRSGVQPGTILLIAAGGLLLLALPFVLLRGFKARRQAPAAQVNSLYRQIRRALGWAGLASVPSVTPDEYLALYDEQLAPYARLNQALRQTTALYRETVYSPRPPDAGRVRTANRLWQSSLREWLLLYVKAAWERSRRL